MSEEAKVETTETESQEPFEDIFHSELDGPAPVADKEPEPAAEAKAEEAPEKETEAEPEKEDAKGEEAEEAKGEPPAPEDVKDVPLNALLDEREKRQKAEKRLEELEAKDEDKAERPDLLEDPEGFAKSVAREAKEGALELHFQASEHRAKKEHGVDVVDEAMEIFLTMVKADPLLKEKAFNHPDPFDFVMETATNHKQIEEAGGLEEWKETERTKIRSEEKAKLEAEATGKSDAKKETRDALPETLAGEANKGERTGPEWTEPDLADLVTNIEDAPPTK